MTKLSERVERLEGPDREIDCLIGVAVGWFVTEPNKGWPDRMDYIDIRGGTKSYPGGGFDQLVSRYTASLDAAMSLVPEGYSWILYSDGSCEVGPTPIAGSMMDAEFTVDAETPAIALCAAALKSRGL